MRSVFVYLRGVTEAEIAAHLDRAYPGRRDPWVMHEGDDAFLYIRFYRDGPTENEPEDWADIVRRFGGEPAAVVIADVSGRHPGDEQAAVFVAGLLGQFDGAAMDEYTTHLWSLEELRGGRRVKGHLFFDCAGWYAEAHRDADKERGPGVNNTK